MTIPQRLAALRTAMKAHDLDAYYVADLDPHQSEYVADHWKSRTWLSGFDGSAGTLIVTADEAKLWTDSRYFLQGESQLAGTGIDLMRQGEKGVMTIQKWLNKKLIAGDRLGRDGNIVSVGAANRLEEKLSKRDIEVCYDHDLFADVWPDRPPLPATEALEHDEKFTQETRTEKLQRLRDFMAKNELEHYLLVGLDEIAWTLNVRGNDVEFNPLVLSYLLVHREGATWFCGPERIPGELSRRLKEEGVKIADYADVIPALQRINATDEPLGLDPNLTAACIYLAAGGDRTHQIFSPVARWKSIKGPKEIEHIRASMARDGVALLRLRRWLSEAVNRGTNEVAVSEKLTELRATGANYFGDSFPAIVGYRGNGAIVHYRAEANSCAEIEASGLLLLDSGGQYLDGTTDITRTFALSDPTADEKLHYTLVLQGHINLGMARFPEGTVGRQLDVLARNPLWQHALNYGHGTGHGVGYFLNVHEGPMGIRGNHTKGSSQEALRAGQILSNEPGYYRTGEYGIRIENLVVVKATEPEGWLEFEDLTVFPMERSLVDFSLLSEAQKTWLRDYHAKVEAAILPLLEDEGEIDWLKQACGGW
ncbi:hypothetical protein CEQ90_12995 [Lewinellaceae bacterium SD302]|nr:hypothetical protein CEQ90_12995 [Lewinellaceae bacterium SD302]